MKNILLQSILVLSIALFLSVEVEAATITAKIEANRNTCYAPCGIHFQGTSSTDASGNSIDTSGLHGNDIINYEWDFGVGTESDASSLGRFFNGFNAGHVFESPGVYTVALTITDKNGDVNTTSMSVNISERAGEMFCFSNDQDFSSCPSGATQIITQSWSGEDGIDVLDYVSPDRVLLLKRGDSFTCKTPAVMGGGPLLISSFGDGERPMVDYIGVENHDAYNAPIYRCADNVSIEDIYFDMWSEGNSVRDNYGGNPTNLLLLRTSFDSEIFLGDYFFLVDSSVSNEIGNPMYSSAKYFVLINNDIGPSKSHGVYGSCNDHAIYYHNTFHDVSNSGRTGIRLAGNTCFSKNVLV